MTDFINHLLGWLGELNLPEPEIAYPVSIGGRELCLNVAYPEQRLGLLWDDSGSGLINEEGWTIWRCSNVEEARTALVAIGQRLGVAPRVAQLEFGRIEDLLNRGQVDMAREELDRLQSSINTDHPDWDTCEEWGRKIRRLQRKKRRTATRRPLEPKRPMVSVAQLLRADRKQGLNPRKLNSSVILIFIIATPGTPYA